MEKWARLAQKRAGRVGIFNLSTRCNPARLTRQFSGPKRASPPTHFFLFFLFLKLKIIKK